MVLLDLFVTYGPWAWIVTGLVLLALELVVPGGYFLWLGSAGIVTGLLAFIPGLTWPWQVSIFGVLAIAIVVGWSAITRNRKTESADNPFLNSRAERFVGHEAVIDEPIRMASAGWCSVIPCGVSPAPILRPARRCGLSAPTVRC